jgi:hypothetical protein
MRQSACAVPSPALSLTLEGTKSGLIPDASKISPEPAPTTATRISYVQRGTQLVAAAENRPCLGGGQTDGHRSWLRSPSLLRPMLASHLGFARLLPCLQQYCRRLW